MQFRMTSQATMNAAVRQAQLRQVEIARLQDQLATGLRISKPSDSPSEWGTLSANKRSIDRMNVELENIESVRQRLNQSVATLTEAGNILVRARELALDGLQPQHPETLAQEVDLLIDSLLQVANTSAAGVHLYGGTASHQNAFEVTDVDENGRPTEIRYFGAVHDSEAVVSSLSTSPVLVPGTEAFQQQDRSTSQYLGKTGAEAGTGTDNARGVATLVVRHVETIYGSGQVSPGASSVGGDTIVGPPGAHKLVIADDPTKGRVVSLNGGGAQPFDASSTDLKVVAPNGQAVFVDLSALPNTFTGEISIEARGTISVDGGATETDIDYSTNQLLEHGTTGRVTVVNTSNVRQAGRERVEYTGTNGAFEALMQLRDDLRSFDDWSTEEFTDIMTARMADVERVHGQIMEFVGDQSVELSNLERLENKTRELRLTTQEAVIETENADVTDVIVKLQTQQNHLQFIYAATARMNQVNLLDFL